MEYLVIIIPITLVYFFLKSSLKSKIDKKVSGWSNYKLSALIMACFTIEAFANHIGKELFKSWDAIDRGISPMGKLKLFIEMKKIEIN
jgi:hypothetical protein